MWLDSTAQRRYVMDGITELACFLRKNRDLSIENSLRLIECTLAPLLAFSEPVIIWPEKEFKRLTTAFVRCNKEAWQMSTNTSTALFTFPKDQGGLQIKMPRASICSAAWAHLTRCCQFDDGTRQLAEITYKDALEKHGCLDMEDLQFESKFRTWDQASQNSFTFACRLTSTIGIRVSWDPFNPDWIASAANADLAQVMINTQHPIHIHLKNEQKWAQVVEVNDEGRLATMRTDTGDIFMMKTEGQDTTTGYPTLREAIQRTFPTLVRLSQLTEPNRIYGTDESNKDKRKIVWGQAIYPIRARLQELKLINLSPEKWDHTLEDKLIELKRSEQVFMSIRPKLIKAAYTTLESIPRIQKGSGTKFYCPALKGVDSKTKERVTRWIQLLHKHPAHLQQWT